MQHPAHGFGRKLVATMVSLAMVASFPANADLFGFESGSDSKDNHGNVVSGSAGPDGNHKETLNLEKCDKPFGTLAVAEPQEYAAKALMQYGLPSPHGLIRLIIQQSNCFVVVERGVAMQNIMQERQLAESGLLRSGSNMGKGQMVTADYVVTPDVVFSQKDAGGIGGALGGLGLFGAVAGVVAAGLKFKQAQTSMTLADARSSLQIAAAQGSAEKTDWGVGGGLLGSGGFGALGAYSNTAEGKVVAASFVDNWNNIVRSIRNNPQMVRQEMDLKKESGKVVTADGWADGDVVVTKIGNVKLYEQAGGKGRVVATLSKGEELVFMGKEEGTSVYVQAGSGEGWVSKNLLKRN